MNKPRRVKEFKDVSEYTTLDGLIEVLEELKRELPDDAEPELKMRGDDVFGRKLTIQYYRPQTQQEIELEKKYTERENDGS